MHSVVDTASWVAVQVLLDACWLAESIVLLQAVNRSGDVLLAYEMNGRCGTQGCVMQHRLLAVLAEIAAVHAAAC